MDTDWIIFASVLLLNTMAALVIASLLIRRPPAPGLNTLVFMLSMLALWSFGYAMITLAPSLEVKRFWLKVENIGILSVPVLWFFFTIQYTRLDKWLNKYTGALFFIIPMVTMIYLLSNNWFHYYYASIHPASDQGGPLVIERGPWYSYALLYSYLLDLISMGLLVWRAFQYRYIYRRQMFALIGAVLIPILVNVFYQAAPTLVPAISIRVDLTPISFTLSAALIAFGVFELHIFDLMPIARHTVMEHIPEMVFVVDAHNHVLDANVVAQKWLGKTAEEIIGRDPVDVFHGWPELLKRYQLDNETREEIVIPGDPQRTLELVVSHLHDPLNNLLGRVLVAHDITEHKRLENELRIHLAENESLRDMLQEQAIRDPLTNVYNRRFLAESLDRSISSAKREEKPVSIVIMDVDHFKDFNDVYGHKCGDVVLQSVARFLVDTTRQE
ncbi:MAG TPA: histidine kinase N-terminal 7TM domain-containing protein, partial [Anaerolineales bacterium]|nr:histidine kinase N-terminal 7TM domain-containing protein [Anaerolineales bacterium]